MKKKRNWVVPALVSTFMMAMSSMAQADCAYEANEKKLESISSGQALFGNKIPIVEGFDEEKAGDVGDLMNFECLYDDPLSGNTLHRDRKDTPRNIHLILGVKELLLDFRLSFRFCKQEEYMSADVTPRSIILNFDPDEFLSSSRPEPENSKLFMESVLSILARVGERQTSVEFQGRYSIQASTGPTKFISDTGLVTKKDGFCPVVK